MTTLDKISWGALVVAFGLAAISHILIRKGVFRPHHYPLALGLGSLGFGVLFSLTVTIAMRREGRTFANTLSDLPWVVALSAVAYLGGLMLARRARKQ